MKVSQPTYQRWETGKASVPNTRLTALAKVLNTSVEALGGHAKYLPAASLDEKETIYFGEVVIHFKSGAPFIASITSDVRKQIHKGLQRKDAYLIFETINNRALLVRRAAISDLYLTDEACDDHGPEEYEISAISHSRSDEEWFAIEEGFESDPEDQPYLLEDHYKKLREAFEFMSEEEQSASLSCTKLTWQLSNGKVRSLWTHDMREDLARISLILDDPDTFITDDEEFLLLDTENGYQNIFINLKEIDYVAVPLHRMRWALAHEAESVIED